MVGRVGVDGKEAGEMHDVENFGVFGGEVGEQALQHEEGRGVGNGACPGEGLGVCVRRENEEAGERCPTLMRSATNVDISKRR